MSFIRDFIWGSRFFPRKLSVTKEGKIVILISFGLGFAAVNTGNNLLYLLFGLALSLIVISGILSEINLRRFTIDITIPKRCQAKTEILLTCRITSNRKRYAFYSVEVWPIFEKGVDVIEKALFLEVNPGKTEDRNCKITFPLRGEYKLQGIAVSTSFPFSFFEKAYIKPCEGLVYVYPKIYMMDLPDYQYLNSGFETSRPVFGIDGDFFGVREFRDGDNPKRIHYRLSAGKPNPILVESEDMGSLSVWLVLKNIDQGYGNETVEKAIEKTASMAKHLLEKGFEVGVVTCSGVVSKGRGGAQLERILDFLAVLPILVMNKPGIEDAISHFEKDLCEGWIYRIEPVEQ